LITRETFHKIEALSDLAPLYVEGDRCTGIVLTLLQTQCTNLGAVHAKQGTIQSKGMKLARRLRGVKISIIARYDRFSYM
jgi:hypothetical protein